MAVRHGGYYTHTLVKRPLPLLSIASSVAMTAATALTRRALRHLDGERVGGRARAGEDAASAAAAEVDDLVLYADALELELGLMPHVISHTCHHTSP